MLASRRTKARATLHLYHFFSRNFSKQQKIFQGALARARAQKSCMQRAETVIYPENLKFFHARSGRTQTVRRCVCILPDPRIALCPPGIPSTMLLLRCELQRCRRSTRFAVCRSRTAPTTVAASGRDRCIRR